LSAVPHTMLGREADLACEWLFVARTRHKILVKLPARAGEKIIRLRTAGSNNACSTQRTCEPAPTAWDGVRAACAPFFAIEHTYSRLTERSDKRASWLNVQGSDRAAKGTARASAAVPLRSRVPGTAGNRREQPSVSLSVFAGFPACSRLFALPTKIGETGFEPATARPPAGCATRLRHSPWLSSGRRESNPF
jgi:hypothetical protein